jgi:hypothetical protein
MGGRGSGPKRDLKKLQRAVELRGRGFTFTAIAARLGMTHEGVRQMLIATGHYHAETGPGRWLRERK